MSETEFAEASAFYESADEDKARQQRSEAEKAEARRLAAFRAVMATADGRRWIWWLLDRCGVFRTSFTGDSTTFFNEGSRNVGLMVIADINAACPDLFVTMMTEARDPNP